MKQALAYIEQRKHQLGDHAFVRSLQEPELDLERAVSFIPYGMFWVLTFQDIIKINASLTHDPAIRPLVEQHMKEDTGHHEWFLDDMDRLFGTGALDIRWLFASQTLPMREIGFALISEIYRITHDGLRLVLLEALEAAGSVLIGAASRFLIASGHIERIEYFAPFHLQLERDHEMFTDQAASQILAIELPKELGADATAMVDRVFDVFTRFGDLLLEQRRSPAKWPLPPVLPRS